MASPGTRQPSRLVRTFGIEDPAATTADNESSSASEPSVARRILGRISFARLPKRPSSLLSRQSDIEGDDYSRSVPGTPGRPPVPTVMQASGEIYTTRLPVLPMVVLSIVCPSYLRICVATWLILHSY